jgi:hypothetical protein
MQWKDEHSRTVRDSHTEREGNGRRTAVSDERGKGKSDSAKKRQGEWRGAESETSDCHSTKVGTKDVPT